MRRMPPNDAEGSEWKCGDGGELGNANDDLKGMKEARGEKGRERETRVDERVKQGISDAEKQTDPQGKGRPDRVLLYMPGGDRGRGTAR